MGSGGSGETFTTLPEVTKLQGPSVKFDLLDVTSHSTIATGNFREYIPGLADGDNIAFDMNWMPSNTAHKDLNTRSYARTLANFKTVFPEPAYSSPGAGSTVLCATYITGIQPKADIGAVLTASSTLKITGAPVWS
jgi:hypothetical protein